MERERVGRSHTLGTLDSWVGSSAKKLAARTHIMEYNVLHRYRGTDTRTQSSPACGFDASVAIIIRYALEAFDNPLLRTARTGSFVALL